jgi:hypothetical protein
MQLYLKWSHGIVVVAREEYGNSKVFLCARRRNIIDSEVPSRPLLSSRVPSVRA